MQRMLAITFDDERKAYEGSRALQQLDSEGSIAIHALAVIKKNQNGTVSVEQAGDDVPIRTLGGTALGSLIGLLGGPVGLGIGAVTGAMAGSIGDFYTAGVDADFLDEVGASLSPGKCAVIAEVSEDWVTPVDTRMESLGGIVFRTTKKEVGDELREQDIAELRSEIAQLKAEHAKARADRKAKIEAHLDKLDARLETKLDAAKQRSEHMKKETQAKIAALQKKAERAHADARAKIEAQVKDIRDSYERSGARFKHMLAGQLTAAAGRLEQ